MSHRSIPQRAPASVARRRTKRASSAPEATATSRDEDVASAPTPRPGTKAAQLLALLGRPEGAALADLITATSWLPHTVRAALTGLRRKGHTIAHDRTAAGGSVYRLTRTEG